MTNQSKMSAKARADAKRADAMRENLKRRKIQQKDIETMMNAPIIQAPTDELSETAARAMGKNVTARHL